MLIGGAAVGVCILAAGVWIGNGQNLFDLWNGVPVEGNGESVQLAEAVFAIQAEEPEAPEELVALVEPLPSRFDLREQGTAPTVPDQGTFGTCWAFASLGALESSMPADLRQTLSADHMSLQNSFGLSQNDGGDYSIATSYLLAWQGPVAEADDRYGDGYSPEHLEPVCHLQEFQILKEKDFDAIKRAVLEYGGVQSSFYMPQTDERERGRYYNEETQGFYYDGSLGANHDVVIVGWEDSYPKENFVKEPARDGAFLCMNTWGESFGDRGYFYISYEDSRIGRSSVVYTGVERMDNYDSIYQTDLCGWTGQLGYGAENAWFANVYEAEAESEIVAAGFYATVEDTSYRIYMAEAVGAEVSFAEKKLVAEGHLNHAGFYTVTWEAPLGVDAGERFAVIVEVESKGSTEPVAVEYVVGERTSQVDLSDGEGYISPDGITWQRAETELQCNICLKAYGRKK